MRVEPIREMKDIKAIKRLLDGNPRDKLLFVLGINTGLRAQDLLSLKVSQFKDCKLRDRITVKEKKTGKQNIIIINKEVKATLDFYLETLKPHEDDFLFKSRKGKNYPLTTFRVTRLVKSWAETLNLKGNYGAHSLRKTFCVVQRTLYKVPWETLCAYLNHSSPAVTRIYLGLKSEEVESILYNEI